MESASRGDLFTDLGHLFLGSRLKRLAERLQADAAKVQRAVGIDAQPAELALIAALDRFGPLTVSEAVEVLGVSQPAVTRTSAALVERGIVQSENDEADLRQKTLTLTKLGRSVLAKAKATTWPAITASVAAMCAPLQGTLLEQIAGLERQLSERSLEARALDQVAKNGDVLAVRDYSDDLAETFYAINEEWISSMFELEEKDREVLMHPRERILDQGGCILMVESRELGVVGTCALMKTEEGVFELTKMGVLEKARGRKAGDLLMQAALARASTMKIDTLYLLTNSKCTAAIRLYEKFGFEHDAEIMKRYGAAYARANVAMRYRAT
jgi:DNA-binding MarR family transcriptional regulator/N-acetylglutamate synthase-like GNAT family acetyltransferase